MSFQGHFHCGPRCMWKLPPPPHLQLHSLEKASAWWIWVRLCFQPWSLGYAQAGPFRIQVTLSSLGPFKFRTFFCLWLHHKAYGILVPGPGIEPVPPAVKAWSLNHWTTREVPNSELLLKKKNWELSELRWQPIQLSQITEHQLSLSLFKKM